MSVLYHYIHVYTCVLCCFALFVCLTLLASFFLPSHLSFKNMYTGTCNAGTFLLLGALESCEVCLNEELDSTALGERGGEEGERDRGKREGGGGERDRGKRGGIGTHVEDTHTENMNTCVLLTRLRRHRAQDLEA